MASLCVSEDTMSELNPDTYIDVLEEDALVDKATEATEEIKRVDQMHNTLDEASRKSFNLEAVALVLEGLDLSADKARMLAIVGLDEPGLNPDAVMTSYSAEGFVDGALMILEKIIDGLKRLWAMIRKAATGLWDLLTNCERGLRRAAEAAKRRTHLVPKGEIRLGIEARYLAAGNKLPATHSDVTNAIDKLNTFADALFVHYSKQMPNVGKRLIDSINGFDIAKPEASLIAACNAMTQGVANPVAALCFRAVASDTRFDAGPTGKVQASEALLWNHSFFSVNWDTNQQGNVLITAEKIRRSKIVFTDTYEQLRAYDTEAVIPAFFAEGVAAMATAMADVIAKGKTFTSSDVLDQSRRAEAALESVRKRVANMRSGDEARKGPVTYYRTAVDFINTYSSWTSKVQLEYANYLSQVGRSVLRLAMRNLTGGLK